MMFFFVLHVISVVLTIMGTFEVLFNQLFIESRFRGIKDSFNTSSNSTTKNTLVVPKMAQRIPDQILEAERHMENFVDVLKRFANGTVFDFTSFESKMKDLGEQLTNITVSVANVTPCKELTEKLHYAKKFYDVMTESAESMRRYKDLGIAVIQWSAQG
ncbi:hypothetical protein OXX80_006544 [Metschnikowia pulcherrima]